MMVNNDGRKTKLCRVGQWIMSQHATIQREQQFAALPAQKFHRMFAGSITFGQTIGHMHNGISADSAEKQLEDGGGRNAIHIIIRDDANGRFRHDGFGQICSALFHVLQCRGLRHQGSDCRVQESFRLIKCHTAGRHDAAENFRQFVALGNGFRKTLILQPCNPAPAAC